MFPYSRADIYMFGHAVAGRARSNRLYCPQSVIQVLEPSVNSSVAVS